MSTGNVHLIVTCTRRKTLAAGETVFPDERDAGKAYGLWLERLAQARRGSPPMTAGELYGVRLENGKYPTLSLFFKQA
ncbi:TPA: hypothetical protein KEY70_003964 [Enterobacter bugandensis]|nr:hypothetical protein [Enterobacter bugandensis]